MAGRPYVLEETTWKTVRETKYEVAILPWGATEAHNFHLPFGTDNIEVKDIAVEAAVWRGTRRSESWCFQPYPSGSTLSNSTSHTP